MVYRSALVNVWRYYGGLLCNTNISLSIFISVRLMYMLKSSLIHHSGGSGVGNTDSFINHNVNRVGTRVRSGGVVGLD